MVFEAQKSAAAAQQQLQNDVDAIDQYNSSLSQINDRVVPVLNNISGQNLGPDTVAWQTWLNNLVGFNTLQASEPPTITENVPLAYQPQPIPLGTFICPDRGATGELFWSGDHGADAHGVALRSNRSSWATRS